MINNERRAASAFLRFTLVIAALAFGFSWWQTEKEPDLRTDLRLRLQPDGAPSVISTLGLVGGVHRAWEIPVARSLRFRVDVPGDDPVLRFHEAFMRGLPDLEVRVSGEKGDAQTVYQEQASENAWAQRRVPLPAEEGDRIIIDFVARDGKGRKGLGLILLADVVLESGGRLVDETDLPLTVRVVSDELLRVPAATRRSAPSTEEGALFQISGPACTPLERGKPLTLGVHSVPVAGELTLVLNAAREVGVRVAGDGVIVVREVGAGELARVPFSSGFGAGEVPEVQLILDVGHREGERLELVIERDGGSNVFVGLRDAYMTRERSLPRRFVEENRAVNVLMVLVDGLRADRLGCFGYSYGETHSMDGLAERGLRYTRVIAPTATAVGNVASFMTGTSPFVHGLGWVSDRVLSQRVSTLPQSAAWSGLSTACFSNSAIMMPVTGMDRGFETLRYGAFPASTLAEEAVDWIHNQQQNPWLCVLHFNDPEPPHQIEMGVQLPQSFDPNLQDRLTESVQDEALVQNLTAEWGVLYDAEVSRVDRALGRILDHLETIGVADHTLVMVMGTVGLEFLEHGGHGNGHALVDEVVRVPLLVAGPGVEAAGVEVDSTVEFMDVTRLIGKLSGIVVGRVSEGRLPEPYGPLSGGEDFAASYLFDPSENGALLQESCRAGRWLLLRDSRTGELSLFDMEKDPSLTVDLSEQNADNEILLRMNTMETAMTDRSFAGLSSSAAWAVPVERLR